MKAVLVTTEYRGVFFGYMKEEPGPEREIFLYEARNCIYWSRECMGFLGLAQTGPIDGCRVGPAVSEIKLYGVTSVSIVTEVAKSAWEEFQWTP